MQQTYSLYELTSAVQEAVNGTLTDDYWVTAEISELRVNASGHCYLELVEKNPSGDGLLARARAMIWNNQFLSLKTYFEKETHQSLESGIKVLVLVQANFHPLYGFSLTIHDINPSYTVGDLAMRRRNILQQLEEEGVLHMNQELPFPELPKRIAVISSDTAAGYGDFCNQLAHNSQGFAFTSKLFPAVMQGERVEKSIIQTLEHISEQIEDFDVVVIIRGGGATTDLAGFDSLPLAENCVQFPLPIITGIGHERDDTVLDLISHTRVKTPTAAAAFLISRMEQAEERLQNVTSTIANTVRQRMEEEKVKVNQYTHHISLLFTVVKERENNQLQMLSQQLQLQTEAFLQREKNRLHLLEEKVKSANPLRILSQGYTLTLKNGKIVKGVNHLQRGDHLTTRFADGEIQSTVN